MEIGLDRLIEITPGVLGGKPRLAGHRISVADVSIWHYKMGMSPEHIAAHYNVAPAKVYAAIAYYLEHREEIEKKLAEDQAFVEEMRKKTPSLLQARLQPMNHG